MIDVEDIYKKGKLMKLYRELMGAKQCDMSAELKTQQGNYSKMERGLENPGWRFDAVRKKFEAWREQEIEILNKQIEYLKNL
jgi:predicted transcriptional regulator